MDFKWVVITFLSVLVIVVIVIIRATKVRTWRKKGDRGW